jgi:hypothetical protein
MTNRMTASILWGSSKLMTGLGLVCLIASVTLDAPVLAVLGFALVALRWASAKLVGQEAGAGLLATPSLETFAPGHEAWRSFVAAAAFTLVAFFFLRSWEVAWIVMASLAVHELGHMLAARAMGVPARLGFSLMGAWTWTPLPQRAALSEAANTVIHLAGPGASLAYALLALLVHGWLGTDGSGNYWLRLANLNALLCLLNVLPLGELSDGGKMVRRTLHSVSPRARRLLLLLFAALPVVVAWSLIVLPLGPTRVLALAASVVWFGLALLRHNRIARERGGNRAGSMSGRQGILLFGGSLVLFAFSLTIVLVTPFWLTEGHALSIAYGFGHLLAYVGWQGPLVLRFAIALAAILSASVFLRSAGRAMRTTDHG